MYQLETTQFVNWLAINVLWSEISAKFSLLSINNRFCHFKEKTIVLISVVAATELEED